MNTNKKIARIVGILFIIATAAPLLSGIFLGSLNTPNYLVNASANGSQIIIGAILMLIMAVAIASIPAMISPILKKYNGALALGYAAFRTIEAVTIIIGAIGTLLLLTLSQQFVMAGAPDATYFQTIGTLLQTLVNNWGGLISTIIFSISSLILNYILYRSRLIPKWLAIWGFAGAILHIAGGLLGMFSLVAETSALGMVFIIPIALEEMVFAVWLIVKGFDLSVVNSLSAKQDGSQLK
jgi:hypothetical protein